MCLFKLLPSVLLCVLCNLASAAPLPEVLWLRPDFPPIYINNGPLKGRGTADQREAFLMQQMPQFRHTQISSNVARMQEEIRTRDNACSSGLLKTAEREKYMLFSEPLAELLPNGLITLRSRKSEFAPYLNEREELRLAELIASQKFQITVAAERRFGQTIDAALLAGKALGKVSSFNTSDVFATGLLQVTNKQAADALMGYAIELVWSEQRFKQSAQNFVFIPIAGETALTLSHVACSRSPLGEKLIENINTLIRNGSATEAALRAYRDWLPKDVATYYEHLRKSGGKRTP